MALVRDADCITHFMQTMQNFARPPHPDYPRFCDPLLPHEFMHTYLILYTLTPRHTNIGCVMHKHELKKKQNCTYVREN